MFNSFRGNLIDTHEAKMRFVKNIDTLSSLNQIHQSAEVHLSHSHITDLLLLLTRSPDLTLVNRIHSGPQRTVEIIGKLLAVGEWSLHSEHSRRVNTSLDSLL